MRTPKRDEGITNTIVLISCIAKGTAQLSVPHAHTHRKAEGDVHTRSISARKEDAALPFSNRPPPLPPHTHPSLPDGETGRGVGGEEEETQPDRDTRVDPRFGWEPPSAGADQDPARPLHTHTKRGLEQPHHHHHHPLENTMKSVAKLSSPLWSVFFMAWTRWMNFLKISSCSILLLLLLRRRRLPLSLGGAGDPV